MPEIVLKETNDVEFGAGRSVPSASIQTRAISRSLVKSMHKQRVSALMHEDVNASMR
jgi:hypothetical protein